MSKLVVLLAVLAVAAAKPSVYAPGLVHSAYVAAPAVYAAPVAVSHQSRVDYHSSPAFYHAAPVHAAWAAPLALGPYTPAAVLGPHGVPLETAAVVAAKAAHFQAHALSHHGYHHYLKKRSILPLEYSALVAPTAVSHQSRVDIHSSPLLAPVVSHYAPSLYSSPLLSYSPYASPYASPYSAHGLWHPRAYGVHPW